MNNNALTRLLPYCSFLVLLAGGLGGTGAVAADQLAALRPASAMNPHPIFKRLDADGDNRIDRREAARLQGLLEIFDEADLDHDGTLDIAEFNRAVGLPVTAQR
jgi:EF hand